MLIHAHGWGTSALLEHGLADELVLMVDPVLLGKGKRLFAEGTAPRAFTLESTTATPTGIVVQSYKAAGGLQEFGVRLRTSETGFRVADDSRVVS